MHGNRPIPGEHVVLHAAHLGTDTCGIGRLNRKKAERHLKLPRKYHVKCINVSRKKQYYKLIMKMEGGE